MYLVRDTINEIISKYYDDSIESTIGIYGLYCSCKYYKRLVRLKKLNAKKISQEDIMEEFYEKLEEIDCSYNENITSLNHMTNIKIVNISGQVCGLENVEEINCYQNYQITSLNHMKKLRMVNIINTNITLQTTMVC